LPDVKPNAVILHLGNDVSAALAKPDVDVGRAGVFAGIGDGFCGDGKDSFLSSLAQ
jgi:hypothetical protein